MLRRRLLLVDRRASQRTSLQSLLARHTGKRLSEGQLKKLDSEDLQHLLPIPGANLIAEALLSMIQSMSEVIEQLEREVFSHCVKQKAYQLLPASVA